MLTSITQSQIFVLDQDQALDFYVGTLGLEVAVDQVLGFMRWPTVHVPGAPGHQILLEVPGPPALDPATADQVRDVLTKGAGGGWLCLATTDARAEIPDHDPGGRLGGTSMIPLSAANRRAFYIPDGLAHGFQTIDEDSEVFYQMSEFYHPTSARGVRWDDPAFAIDWPIEEKIISILFRSLSGNEYPPYIRELEASIAIASNSALFPGGRLLKTA